PDVDAVFVAPDHPAAVGDRRPAGHVIQIAGDDCDVMAASRPDPRELVEARAARFAGAEVVLVDDEDSHRMLTESRSMRPPGMSNTTRSFSSSIVQRFFASDAEYGAPL